jgi:hypothetical protein
MRGTRSDDTVLEGRLCLINISSALEGIGASIRLPLPQGEGTGGLHLNQLAPLIMAPMPLEGEGSGGGANQQRI